MKNAFMIAILLSSALFVSPVTHAASYQDQAMVTGAIVGGASGAIIGSNQHRAVEGAIFGAVLGTVAGAIIGNQRQSAVAYHHPRPQRSHVIKHRYRTHKATHDRHNHHQHDYQSRHHKAKHYFHHRHGRYVAQGYGHRTENRWRDYRAAKRHAYRDDQRDHEKRRYERHERRNHEGHDDS